MRFREVRVSGVQVHREVWISEFKFQGSSSLRGKGLGKFGFQALRLREVGISGFKVYSEVWILGCKVSEVRISGLQACRVQAGSDSWE